MTAAPTQDFSEAIAASAQADAERIEEVRRFEQELPVLMTLEERRLEGENLAEQHLHIDRLHEQVEAEKARHKVEIDTLKADLLHHEQQASVMAKALRSQHKQKLIECREEKVFATGMIRVVRLDTGETVSERAMEADERQADLFPQGDGPGDLPSDEPLPPPDEVCPICAEPGCARDKVQLACGDFAHEDGDCPLGAFCTGLATISDPEKVLPPEEKTNGKSRKRRGS